MTGCNTADHDRALREARSWADAHGYSGKVVCSPGIGGQAIRKADFICDVHRAAGACDELRVRRIAGRWHVVLRRRGVDCVLPA